MSDALRGAAVDLRLTLATTGSDRGLPAPVRLVAYRYAWFDRNHTELLTYHWHPGPEFAGPDHPHVHVSAALRPALPNGGRAVLPLDKLHLATGPVPLAAFVRTLIEEFGARPRTVDRRERLEKGDG